MPWAIEKRKEYHATKTREKRVKMRAAGICVNAWAHGPAVKGGRCQACWDKKKESQRFYQKVRRANPSWAVARSEETA